MSRLFLLFLMVPIIEILIYVELSRLTNIGFTIFMIIITGIVGAFLAKREGFKVIRAIQEELNCGHIPGNHLIEAFLILIGGLLLMMPGLISDIAGIFFLVPFTRGIAREYIKKRLRRWIDSGKINFFLRY